jgi:CubicO group peptidase (beta-lactamase class C family)
MLDARKYPKGGTSYHRVSSSAKLKGENVMLSGELVEKIETFVAETMIQDHVPGLSLAIVKDGKVVYAKGFGARNLKTNLPATPDTLWGICSCTKSFTAMAVMQLQEQRKLNVNDPVKKYLPEFKVGKDETPIKIQHLLSHSSGIPALFSAYTQALRFLGTEEKWLPLTSFDDVMAFINGAEDEVASEPGKRFFYLDEGYELLGRIIEKVSKMAYKEFVRERILKPLRMSRTTFPDRNPEKDPDVATPYLVQKKDDGFVATPSASVVTPYSMAYPAGGLISSVRELANYLIANMNHGVFEGTKILDSELLQEMHKPRIPMNWPIHFGQIRYGYGWYTQDDFFGQTLVGHAGGCIVANADLNFVPDLNIGVAVACNNGLAYSVNTLMAPVALALLMGKDPLKDIPFFEVERKMAMLTGEYESYKGIWKFSVVRMGGILLAESKDKLLPQSLALIPEDDRLESLKFYTLAGGTRSPVEFVVDPSGKIDLYTGHNRFHKVR